MAFAPVTRFLVLSTLVLLLWPETGIADIQHRVRPGESLYTIAKKYGISTSQIQEANRLPDDKIFPEKLLKIPGAAGKNDGVAKRTAPSPWPPASAAEIPETHVVKKGETPAKIARMYPMKAATLRELNGLEKKRIKSGQTLILKKGEEIEPGVEETPAGLAAVREGPPGRGFLVEEKNRDLLARVAKSFLGVRYTPGGTSIHGLDCSAYVQKVYRIFGIDLPRTAREQFQIGYEVSREALRVGDLLFFKRAKARNPTHVGIYVGNGQFVHTSLKNKRVEIENMGNRYFNLRFAGAKRIEEAKREN